MRNKPLKLGKWLKWTAIAGACVIAVIVMTGTVLYLKLKSTDLSDIQARQQQRLAVSGGEQAEQGGSAGNSAGDQTAQQDGESHLPNALADSVRQAAKFTDKSIGTQDALDVAAILLNSGLSMKEISYLLNQAEGTWTTAEKQRIRNLLLAKPSEEEITTLRMITSQYGKYLVILDPDYPIELVGISDLAERERMKQQLDQQEKAAPPARIDPVSTSRAPPVNEQKPNNSATNTGESSKANQQKEYLSQIQTLQSSCKVKLNKLTGEVVAAIHKGDLSALDDLQTQTVDQLAAAEGQCDLAFAAIISKAEHAGIASTVRSTWSKRYEPEKTSIRNSAMNKLSSLLKE